MYYNHRGENTFETLVKRTLRNNWCHKPGCTTCGAMHVKYEIQRIGIHFILNDRKSFLNTDNFNQLDIDEITEIVMDVGFEQLNIMKRLLNNNYYFDLQKKQREHINLFTEEELED